MNTRIGFGVADRTTSMFVVVADAAPRTGQGLDRPGLGVVVWRAEESPLEVRDILRPADEKPGLPPPSAYHILVTVSAPVRDQPRAVQAARACARGLTAETGGVLIDWAARDVVLGAHRPERATFHLGDHWLGFEFHVSEEAHRNLRPRASPFDPPGPEDACGALRIKTRGLARFGLPELTIEGVDCQHGLTALNVLRGLAQHLLTDHWAWLRGTAPTHGTGTSTTTRRTARRQRVPGRAFAAYWGASFDTDPFVVTLSLSERLLHVNAPRGGPLNGWLGRNWSMLRSLAGCPPDDFQTYAEFRLPAG